MTRAMASTRFDIAAFGELVSDPSRVAILLSLMNGLARPASELASIAHVTPSTASSHLGRLVEGGLLQVESLGRHRYFRLASDPVADALEGILLHVAPTKTCTSPDPERLALSRARMCYRHLAGKLGVAWLGSLESKRLLQIRDGALTLAPRGVRLFEESGLSMARWPVGKACLDWTERRHHLGGGLGVRLTEFLFSLKWIVRRKEKEARTLRVTTAGRAGLARFGLPAAVLE
jgi:DNA-binding transcriptional ArsR family regulator